MLQKTLTRLVVIVGFCALAVACTSGPKIRADGDPSVDFTAYKTFGFFDQLSTDKSKYATMLTGRLKDATRAELTKRGIQESPQPQLLVNFSTNVENRTEVNSTGTSASYGFYGYRGGMYGAWGGYPQDVYTTHYQQGTLAIDLVDASKKQLVWQGVAEARLTQQMRDNPGAAIGSVVADIFAKYPVKAPEAAESK
ncbi:MAG TPA: DUF4136 domain-containing protein [Steroidobacteraceae bacterium]|nr:DUF4136 domain-containing protein [Steroidobacteraceae bacterium]